MKIIGTIATILLLLIAGNTAFYLLRQSSDIAVGLGVLLLLGIFGVVFYFCREAVKKLSVAVVILSLSAACSERVAPGHVGIVVNSYGSDRGVDDYPVTTGRVWYNPFTTDVFQYPTYMQTTELKVTFNDKDGMQIGMMVGVGYSLVSSQVPGFYVKFRTEDISLFTNGFFNNEAQAAFNSAGSRLSAEQIYSTEKEQFMENVKKTLNARLQPYGVLVEQFAIQGNMSLPPQVTEALNAKIQATQNAQRVENELRETQANAQKQIAEAEGNAKAKIAEAEGTARANRLLTESISPTLIEWRRIEVQEKTLWRWNGTLPSTVLNGNVPMVMPGIR